MAEEKKPGKAGEFFFKHGEKVVLILASLALVAYLVIGIAMAKEDGSALKLNRETQRINQEATRDHADMKAPPAKEWVSEGLGPWKQVVSAKTSKNDWVGTLVPAFKYETYKKEVAARKELKIPSIALGNVDVGLEGVTVNWSATGFTVAEMTKDKGKVEYLKLARFLVERELAGSGKWEALAGGLTPPAPPKTARDIPAFNMTYRDGKIEPKTKYNYRVTSFVDPEDIKKLDPTGKDPSVKVNLGTLDPKTGKVEAVETSVPAATLGIWKIKFAQVMKGQAYIEIEKFDKTHGLVRVRHIHYAGEMIGWWKKDPQDEKEEPSSTHTINKDGKAINVDLNCGMKLVSVEPKKVTGEVKRCRRKFDEKGLELPHEPTVDKVTVEVNEVVYTDEDQKEVRFFHPDLKTHPMLISKACPEHGGARPVEAPKETPKKEEAPKEDPKIAAAKARELEAEKIFAEAEKLETRDKNAAINRYQKLLKDFMDTAFVSKAKKAIIEDRIKKLGP